HHFTQLAGRDHLALAGHDRAFDRKQLAAYFGPGETGDLTDLIVLFRYAEAEAEHAKIVRQILGAHRRLGVALLQHQGLHHLATDLGDLALQRTHARFPREVADDVADRALRHVDLHRFETVVLQLLRQQIAHRDVDLLVLGV